MANGMWHRALGAIVDVTRYLQAIGQTIRKDVAQKISVTAVARNQRLSQMRRDELSHSEYTHLALPLNTGLSKSSAWIMARFFLS